MEKNTYILTKHKLYSLINSFLKHCQQYLIRINSDKQKTKFFSIKLVDVLKNLIRMTALRMSVLLTFFANAQKRNLRYTLRGRV